LPPLLPSGTIIAAIIIIKALEAGIMRLLPLLALQRSSKPQRQLRSSKFFGESLVG
jgi:hypothetical protein